MGLSLVTGPASEPITRAQAKADLVIESTAYDDEIDELIVEARTYIEGVTRRALVEQTWDYTLRQFPYGTTKWPEGAIELPMQPVTSVTYVQYVDPTGATQSFTYGTSPDVPKYDVLTDGPRTIIIPKHNLEWPDTQDHGNAVTVRFVAGYATLPGDLRRAMKQLVTHWYEKRGVVAEGQPRDIPLSVDTLLSAYQMRGF